MLGPRLKGLVLCGWLAAGAVTAQVQEPPKLSALTDESDIVVDESPAVWERGYASWLGPGFEGRRTASGERFNMHALTAAHRTLPFGTHVLVRNPRNNKQVVVRINDHGPNKTDRLIDLSRAAAKAIDMLGHGVIEVDIMPVPRPQRSTGH
jgi:rare lipoprotein A